MTRQGFFKALKQWDPERYGDLVHPGDQYSYDIYSQAAQAVRRPEQQVRLARLARQPTTDVIALDRVDATNVGRPLVASGTSDITDAHVVICAQRSRQHVITSDPGDLRALDPAVRLIAL